MKLLKIKILCVIVALCSMQVNLFAVTGEEQSKIESAMAELEAVTPVQDRKILVFSLCKGYVHSSIPYWKAALEVMGEQTGAFSVEFSEDMGVFASENLKKYDAVCFNNTTYLEPGESQQKAILDFVKSGKGIIGIHAATDNFYNWQEGMEMWGGKFTGHPWTAGGTWAVKIDEPGHPLMKSFEGKNFKINDEIYRTESPLYSRSKQRVLMSLDLRDEATKNAEGVRDDDADTGISWIKPVGKGRLFYCSLGHNHHLTWNKAVLGHYLAGIQYALGDLEVDDRPAVEESLNEEELGGAIAELKKFDWGKGRSGVAKIESIVRENCGSAGNCKVIEAKLLDVLDEDVSLAVKGVVCKQLSLVGTDACVDNLLKLLENKDEAKIALYALERIPSRKVDKGLLKIVKEGCRVDLVQPIISVFGNRKCEDAVEGLGVLAANYGDKKIVAACVRALGQIGTSECAVILKQPEMSGVHVKDALLMCANNLCEQGKNKEATDIYFKIYKDKEVSSVIRAAALGGLFDAGYDGRILVDGLGSNEPAVRSMAAHKIPLIKHERLLEQIALMMSDLPGETVVQVFAGLAKNEHEIGRVQFEKIVSQSDNMAIRVAGYRALGVIGNGQTAIKLAEYAANASDRYERTNAQEALYNLPGDDVDKVIMRAIAGGEIGNEKVIVELVKATASRPIYQACGVLVKVAKGDNRRVASESLRVLQEIAGGDSIEEVVSLLTQKPGAATENVVVAVAGRMEADKAKVLIEKYPAVTSEKAKASMLKVMGRISDASCEKLLRKEFESSNETLSEAAFRGMCEWGGDEFLGEMKTQAVSGKNEKTKILATRAYVRMVENAYGGKDASKTVEALIDAFSWADRVDEKKIIIGTLSHYGDAKGLEFVKKCVEDDALKAEAEVAVKSISEKMK